MVTYSLLLNINIANVCLNLFGDFQCRKEGRALWFQTCIHLMFFVSSLQGKPRPQRLTSASSAQTGILRTWALAALTRSSLIFWGEPSPPDSSQQRKPNRWVRPLPRFLAVYLAITYSFVYVPFFHILFSFAASHLYNEDIFIFTFSSSLIIPGTLLNKTSFKHNLLQNVPLLLSEIQ